MKGDIAYHWSNLPRQWHERIAGTAMQLATATPMGKLCPSKYIYKQDSEVQTLGRHVQRLFFKLYTMIFLS